jgi:hypothetical protein
MAIEDYLPSLPNFFGSTPEIYKGLLTTDEQAGLQKRANLGGLLGSVSALAQGMSAQGAPRSALQNILTSIAAGYGAAGQTYESGIGQLAAVQKYKQTQSELARSQQAREAIEKVIQIPEIANNPAMVAYFRANPDKALERFVNIEEAKAARGMTTTPAVPAAPVSKYTTPAATDEEAWRRMEETAAAPVKEPLAPVEVIGTPSKYGQQLREAEAAQAYWSRQGNAAKAKDAREEADSVRNLIRQEELATSVPATLANVHPMLKPMVDTLAGNAMSMTPAEIQSAISDIRKKDADFRLTSETDLRKEYSGLPAIKEFSTVQTAHKQITNALSNPSAANDLAAATKFMKLLDPGSVVRESELGMAMAATGAIDLMGNYLQRLQNGERLNPAQRADFKKAAELAYRAAEETYNQIGGQYVELANRYNLNPDNIVLRSGRTPSNPATPAEPARPEGVGRDWRLSVDAQGNRAYVSPDGTKFKEVK